MLGWGVDDTDVKSFSLYGCLGFCYVEYYEPSFWFECKILPNFQSDALNCACLVLVLIILQTVN